MKKEEERRLARKIVRGVAKEFRSRGFLHAKPTFMVRPMDRFFQFVHFHKFSAGPRFRVHFGVRVMNDPFVGVALNGPAFEHAGTFGPDEERSLECTRKLIALVEEEGLSWFAELSTVDALFKSSRSPLQTRDREALLDEMRGGRNEASWQLSERLLGLTREKA